MDAAGLTILLKEMEVDCAVVQDAAEKAVQRVARESPGHLEATACELSRLFTAFERLLERVCEEFENHFEKRGDYHEKLLQRMALNLDEIRPAFIPEDRLPAPRDLKGFRHVMRHAYDLTLGQDRLAELADLGQRLSRELPGRCREVGEKVRIEQRWTTPD